MKANPGGYIPPSEIFGRDKFVRRLWRILKRQSLVLSAERRIGKTCIIKKMIAEVPNGELPIYHDLEGIRTPMEFARIVYQDVEAYLGTLQRTAGRVRQFLALFGGTEIGGVFKFPDNIDLHHWKTLLTKTIEDLVEHQDRMVIFFWDEMLYMLSNIKQRTDEDTAMEVLDALRSLRQMHPTLRMVFTGSIGLHNVITSLKRAGYVNDPTNDMYTENVLPLSPADAQELACRLLEGEDIPTDNLQATASAIATAVDGIAHYIHHVVDQMKDDDGVLNVATVGAVVDACLMDQLDRWHMHHYLERLDTYYMPEERPFALHLLDVLSITDQPLPFDEVFNQLKSRIVTEDSEMTRRMLTLLQRDHYIVQQNDGKYCFRFPLIKRSWRLQRGLGL